MGQAVKDRSEICPLPPGPLKDLKWHLKPRTRYMAVSLVFMLTTSGLVYYLVTPKPLPIPIPPEDDPIIQYGFIAIDGDANLSDTALLEGWPGDGSPENPYIIEGLDIDLGGELGHCIMISNTRVSFIIRNCNLTGAHDPRPRAPGMIWPANWGAGIELWNVTSGELVNNTCNSNAGFGIALHNSQHNTVANNTCNDNGGGINLADSTYNIVENNTCNNNPVGIFYGDFNIVVNNTCNNSWNGISCGDFNIVANNACSGNDVGIICGDFNTVENNTFNNNTVGILIQYSDSNTVFNNTCNNNNNLGIHLAGSSHNTVENNTCNSNNIGIFLETTLLIDRDSRSTFWDESQNNTVANNICNNNEVGIRLNGSSHNTVENNTCNSNDIGISLNRIQVIYFFNNYEYWAYSLSNNVANNTCNYNRIGIYLLDPHSNTVVNNSFLGNTEHDILEDFAAKKFDTEDLLFIGFVGVIGLAGIIMLGAAWRMFSGIREFTET